MPRVKLGRKPNDEVLISLLWGRQAAMGMPVGTMAEKAEEVPAGFFAEGAIKAGAGTGHSH